ncbi:MAG: hypothetical protein WAV41_05780 [Microgenomates group bacterium]
MAVDIARVSDFGLLTIHGATVDYAHDTPNTRFQFFQILKLIERPETITLKSFIDTNTFILEIDSGTDKFIENAVTNYPIRTGELSHKLFIRDMQPDYIVRFNSRQTLPVVEIHFTPFDSFQTRRIPYLLANENTIPIPLR